MRCSEIIRKVAARVREVKTEDWRIELEITTDAVELFVYYCVIAVTVAIAAFTGGIVWDFIVAVVVGLRLAHYLRKLT